MYLVFVAVAAAATGAGTSVSAQPAPCAPMTEKAELDRASSAFDDAQFRRDVPALDRMIADDLVFVRSNGETDGKQAFVADYADPTLTFAPFRILGRRIVPLGPQSGLVTADGTMRGTLKGVTFCHRFQYTDIFQRFGSDWRAVFVQVTRKPLPCP